MKDYYDKGIITFLELLFNEIPNNYSSNFINKFVRHHDIVLRKYQKYCYNCKKVIDFNHCFKSYLVKYQNELYIQFLEYNFEYSHNIGIMDCFKHQFFDVYIGFFKIFYNNKIQFYCCQCYENIFKID